MEKSYPVSNRNTVKRVPKRGHYDKETVYAILDEGFLAHVGFQVDGQPFVIPTLYGRNDDTIYLHGANTSRLIKELDKGIDACITVTHIDGLVLARSAFHHSMNYRSAVVFGKAYKVPDEEKEYALKVISDHVVDGRWEEARKPNEKELKGTSVLALEIQEASAKIRTGPPSDDKEDYELPIWAGVVETEFVKKETIDDPLLAPGLAQAESIKNFLKK